MKDRYNHVWFKETFKDLLKHYTLREKKFGKGDFGNLHRIEFISNAIMGQVDFCDTGVIDLDVWDDVNEKVLLNLLVFPEDDKKIVFEKLKKVLTKLENVN